jgi:hypothetical protein
MASDSTSRVAESGSETTPTGPPEASTSAAAPPQLLLYQEAYDRALRATAALSEQDLVPVNINVRDAVATVIGALPTIMAYRDEAAKLHGFDIAHFDQLQLHSLAVGYAHAKFLAASAPPVALAALNENATKLRDTMYHDAIALALRGLIEREQIARFKTNVGYKNLASDLLGLVRVFRASWEKIASRTGVQPSDLEQAELLGQRLTAAVGIREQALATVAQAQDQRQRNFTLFSRSYDQVRRAIRFLRWDNDDIDQICPSLFARRGGSRRK